jgi:hypothetical protein
MQTKMWTKEDSRTLTLVNSEVRATGDEDTLISSHAYEEHEAYMSEIQLGRIVDNMAREASAQGTAGDEVMIKDGKAISKFSKGTLEIGAVISIKVMVPFSERRMEPPRS